MKRGRRRIFNALAATSLILSLATAVVWVRSHWLCDYAYYTTLQGKKVAHDLSNSYGIMSSDGVIEFRFLRDADFPHEGNGWKTWDIGRIRPLHEDILMQETFWTEANPIWSWMNFNYGHYSLNHWPLNTTSLPIPSIRYIEFPYWFPMIIFSSISTLIITKIIRQRRRDAIGHCTHCGYDLRATPEWCPECGTIPTKAVT